MTETKTTTVYEIRDRSGRVVAEHHHARKGPDEKQCFWKQPNGKWGLNGTRLEELPLYGSEDLGGSGEFEAVVLCEGEKAADALRRAGIPAVGTVTGAGQTPSIKSLGVLEGRRVCLWPDNDGPGREHMDRIGARLEGIAAEVLIFEWEDAPEKGDAADHPGPEGLLRQLEAAPCWKPPKATLGGHQEENLLLAGRVDIGAAVEGKIDPPEELEPDVLLKGMIHHFFGPSESGKTVLALWLIKRRVEARQRVVFFDAENGTRTIGERLQQMGADPDLLREYLVYLPFPSLSLDARYRQAFEELLDQVKPEAIFFDSWASFLSMAGLSENENSDVEHWDTAFTKMVKKRGITSAILDHVPHEGQRSRGAARKKEVADVQWRVKKTQEFNRDVVGEVLLIREKDREGWLPGSVGFSVGGAEGTLVCARSSGTVEEADPVDGLTESERKVFDALCQEFGQKGARASEWQKASKKRGVSRASHFRAVKKLVSPSLTHEPLVRLVDETYFPVVDTDPPNNHETGESTLPITNTAQVSQVSNRSHETCETGAESQGLTGLSPLKGETVRPTADTTPARTVREALEALRTTALAPLVEQFFGGTAETPILASAVAAHYREGGRWKEWREPTLQALDELKENRVAAVEDEST